MSKLVICGSREFPKDAYFIQQSIHSVMGGIDCIVSGGARGPDTWAREYAENLSIPFIEIKADWNKYGKKAGYLRNIEMLELEGVSKVLAFWDGVSRGTKHTIDCALARCIDTHVVFPEEE